MLSKLAIAGYILGLVGIFLYSFVQIDLNLTLQESSRFYFLQQYFQQIGYFNRPLSTYLYSGVMMLLLLSHIGLFLSAKKKQLSKKIVTLLILFTAGILLFSYPAFSYDLFNYMFDARIVTKYAQNPYIHKALDYPEDPWILFMRWTHRTYPYGPLWLGITIPLSYIGSGAISATFLLFKTLATLGYLVTGYVMYKFVYLINRKYALSSVILFATNPLVLAESLISAHNDIVMMALMMGAFLFLIQKRTTLSLIMFVASAAVKFVTLALLPIYLWIGYARSTKKKINWEHTIFSCILLMFGSVVLATIRTSFQPWYLLYPFVFMALLPQKPYVVVPMIVLTIGALLQYVPFLYTGGWDDPIPLVLNSIMLISLLLSIFYLVGFYIHKKALS